MELIGGINLYSLRSAQMKKELKKETLGDKEEKKTVDITKKTEIAPNDVLSFMASQAVSMKVDVTQTLKVTKCADTTEYQRISDMMKEFEAEVEYGLKTFDGEFPNIKISEDSKMKLVLNSLERRRI